MIRPTRHTGALHAIALVVAMSASSAALAQARLLSDHRIAGDGERVGAALADALGNPAARRVQLVRADAAAVTLATSELAVDLGDGRTLRVEKASAYANEDGTLVWEGAVGGLGASVDRMRRHGAREALEDPLNSMTLVRDGGMLTGSIHAEGRLFTLEPLADGRHVLVEVDQSRLPGDEVSGRPLPVVDMPVDAAADAAAAPAVIRVLVAFSARAGEATPSPGGWAQAVIADANRGYENSGVNARLVLAGVRRTGYVESNPAGAPGADSAESFLLDLTRFGQRGEGHLDDLHRIRNETRADVMMLVRRPGELCGRAWSIGSTADTAFAVMSRTCGAGTFTFHHEIGHLQGARHDLGTDGSLQPKPYAHGMQRPNASTPYRTMMAYACPAVECGRIAWLSTPNVTLYGVPTGNATRADNRRVVNESRNRVAGYR